MQLCYVKLVQHRKKKKYTVVILKPTGNKKTQPCGRVSLALLCKITPTGRIPLYRLFLSYARRIICGKPLFNCVVDDKNIEFNGNWKEVEYKIWKRNQPL